MAQEITPAEAWEILSGLAAARQAYLDATMARDELHRQYDRNPDNLELRERFHESVIAMDEARERDHELWQRIRDITEPTPR